MKVSKQEREKQLENLRKWFPKGSTVYTILRSVSRSGMQRSISVVGITWDGRTYETGKEPVDRIETWHPNYAVSTVCGYRAKRGGSFDSVLVNGCGFDAGYDIAHNLARELHGDGYALKHRWL